MKLIDLDMGDVVKLKSGGPLMTVVKLCGKGGWSTTRGAELNWFEGHHRRTAWFPLSALTLVNGTSEGTTP